MVRIKCEYMQVQLLLFNLKFQSQLCVAGFYSNWEEPSGFLWMDAENVWEQCG